MSREIRNQIFNLSEGSVSGSRNWTPLITNFALPENGVSLLVGQEVTIYGDELIAVPIKNYLKVTYTCDIGTQVGNNYVINPVIGDIGNHVLTITFSKGLGSKTINLSVNAKAANGEVKVLVVGDSTTEWGANTQFAKVIELLPDLNVTFLGTQGTTYKHEGYGGYKWQTFVEGVLDDSDPFRKADVLDIASYFSDNSIAVPDIIYIRLGINDIMQDNHIDLTDAHITSILGYADTLINAFLAYNADLRIVLGIPTTCENGHLLWDIDFGSDPYYVQDTFIQSIHKYQKALVDKYANGSFDARVDCSYEAIYLNRAIGYFNSIHLNESGDTEIGEAIALTINKYSAEVILRDGDTYGFYDYLNAGSMTEDPIWHIITNINPSIGSGKPFKQLTSGWEPELSADGLIFTGDHKGFETDEDLSLVQPLTYYLILKPLAWTAEDALFDGHTAWSVYCLQKGTTPKIIIGTTSESSQVDLALNSFAVLTVVINGANSLIQINGITVWTGNIGTTAPNGIAWGGLATMGYCANYIGKGFLVRKKAELSTDRRTVWKFLKDKYGL